MLPFLDKKREASIIVDKITHSEGEESEKETNSETSEEHGKYDDGIRIASGDVMNAIKTGNDWQLVRALTSLIEMINNRG